MKEKDLTGWFAKFMRKDPSAQHLKFPFLIEFKIKPSGKPLNLKRDFQPHQIPTLLKALSGCVYHKISDMSVGIKPCDVFQVCFCPAFIGILWYKPRADKILYLIDPRDIKDLDKLYEDKAQEIAIYTIYLNSKRKGIDIK
jgi:hypothetical protein